MKKKVLLFLLAFLTMIGGSEIVKAVADEIFMSQGNLLYYNHNSKKVVSTSANPGYNVTYFPYKYDANNLGYICNSGNDYWPPLGKCYYNQAKSNAANSIGIAYIINTIAGKSTGLYNPNNYERYYWAEIAELHYLEIEDYSKYMSQKVDGKTLSTIISDAKTYQNKYSNAVDISLSSSTFTFTLNSDKTKYVSNKIYITDKNNNISTITVTKTGNYSKFTLTDTTDSGGRYLQYSIPISSFSGSLTVGISVKASNNFKMTSIYDCPNYQTIVSTKLETKSNTDTATASGTVKNETGSLELLKVDASNNSITSSDVSVKVCKEQNVNSTTCQEKTFRTSITISNLSIGTYYIYETKAPTGYYIPDNPYYVGSVEVKPSTSNNPTTYTITNKNECEYEFDKLTSTEKNSMTKRIELYKNFLNKTPSKNYQNLLNLNKVSGKDACTSVTRSDNYKGGCLVTTKSVSSSISASNLSYYENMISSTNATAFCSSNYTFYSKVKNNGKISSNIVNDFYGNSINFGSFKSGRMVLKLDIANRKIAEGTLTITCYVAGTDKDNYAKNLSFDYRKYVDKVCLTDDGSSCNTKTNYLVEDSLTSSVSNVKDGTELIKHTTTLKYDYLLRPIYGKYGSGEIVQNSSNSRLLGYGIISKFGDYGEKKLKFEIPSLGISNKLCKYDVEPEIVECIGETCNSGNTGNPGNPINPGTPWELNLAFRQISKSNPFPGKSGNGRKVNSNWCDGNNCNNNNKTVEETITNKNDSYNSTGDGPIYTINLNTKTIEQIKNKNKGQAYDDFGENCNTSSGTCAIDFINWMKSQGILEEG